MARNSSRRDLYKVDKEHSNPQSAAPYEFDRKLKPDNAVGLSEIHGLCDVGEKAYGAVMCLTWKLANGSYFCVPLMVKAFVHH